MAAVNAASRSSPARPAGIGLAEGARGQGVLPEHEVRMPGKPAVDADRPFIL
jgi:hypothetical protein